MDFRFIHVADLHLGSPFLGLAMHDPATATQFQEASRVAFTTLVSETIACKAAFIVIAGDIYDGDWKDMSIGLFFNRELSRLDQAGIPTYVIRGNHDAESVITRTVPLPQSVHVFSSRQTETFRIDPIEVALHGRSFPHRDVKENLADSYPPAIPGWFNVGVLHTGLSGRPNHDNYAPCTAADLRSHGYQYWALGHIHEYEVVSEDPWIVFPGNLQGRDAGENGPKGAVLVTVNAGEVRQVERLIVDQARWVKIDVDLSSADTLESAIDLVEKAARPHADECENKPLAARVRLHGVTSLYGSLMGQQRDLRDKVQAALDHVHGNVQLEKLIVDPSPPATVSCEELPTDLTSGLDGVDQDPAFRHKAEEALGSITRKLPAIDGAPSLDNLDALISEAREMVLGRANS